MDVYFVLNGITFVWNDDKAQLNPVKHDGITFQQAAEAFFDPLLVVGPKVAKLRNGAI